MECNRGEAMRARDEMAEHGLVLCLISGYVNLDEPSPTYP